MSAESEPDSARPYPERIADFLRERAARNEEAVIALLRGEATTAEAEQALEYVGQLADMKTTVRKLALARAEAAAASEWPSRLSFATLDELQVEAPGPRLLDRYHPTAHTIIFGPGGVGKGSLLANDLIRLARAGHRPLIIDFEQRPEEWKPRIYSLGGMDIFDQIGYVTPPPGAIWEEQQLADLAFASEHHSATILVVDSIVMACQGSDTSSGDTKAPTMYAGAIAKLGLPTISLAHVPKENKNPEHPFGSAFWTYTARQTYSLTAKGEHRILQSRKSNNYEHAPKTQIELIWDDNRLLSVDERPYQQALTEAIEDVLIGVMTISQITADVNKPLTEDQTAHTPKAVEQALDRGLKKGTFTKAGKTGREGLWSRNPPNDEGVREGDGIARGPSAGSTL